MILIVDDSPTIVMMEKTILTLGDFDTAVAGDGAQALEAVAKSRPDLILMDAVMPHLDGFETVKRLRADPDTRDLPIIMVTTKGEAGQRDKGLAAGCDDCVTKPIDARDLIAKISALID
jgi:CheY-like chemotaxis protein